MPLLEPITPDHISVMPLSTAENLTSTRHHARILSDLRQGVPIILQGQTSSRSAVAQPANAWLVLPLDTASEAEWQAAQALFEDTIQPAVLLSAERAALLATGGAGVDHGGMAAIPTVPEPEPDLDPDSGAREAAREAASEAASDVARELTPTARNVGIMLPMAAVPGFTAEQAVPVLADCLRGLVGLNVQPLDADGEDGADGPGQGQGLFGLRAPDLLGQAITLLKTAFLVPAALVWPLDDKTRRAAEEAGFLTIAERLIDIHHDTPVLLPPAVSAPVPLEMAVNAKLHVYRGVGDGREHVAIEVLANTHDASEVHEAPEAPKAADDRARARPGDAEPPLVRLHAACFTGDLLGSLRCDCGDQLRGALALMAKQGGGVLLYMAQEGRDIGLINKLRAYRLQDAGLDTIDANLALGFAADERDYGIAAAMLRDLGHPVIRLLTNNPDKIAQLEAAGIVVSRRVAHNFPPNPHNRAYIATKQKRAGHLVD